MKPRMIIFERVIKTGLLNCIRNAWLAVAGIAVMVITLTIILFSFLANQTFANTIQQITDKIDVSVYLNDNVNEQQRAQLVDQLQATGEVKSVTFVSKEQALENYKKQNQGNADLQAAISQTDNPLPATLQLKPVDPNDIQKIKTFLEKPEIKKIQAAETSYSGSRKEAIDNITQAAAFLRKAGIVGIVTFAIVSILIIFNTIRMAIFNRRDELTIMRLLGANTWYIRGPFVVETVLYGVIAAVVSVVLVNSLFVVQANAFNSSSLGLLDINFTNNYFASHFWIILLAQLLIGTMIGAFSSVIATRRYLKFKAPK
jgi:cell division transport system permease protein